MKSIAKKGDLAVLAWLHDKYRDDVISYPTLESLSVSYPQLHENWMQKANSATDVTRWIKAKQQEMNTLPHVFAQTPAHSPEMEEQKVMTVVELVLREQERITSLPNIVRSIRQFIQASLLARLKGIMLITSPSVSRIEQILTMDSEDRRLEALERNHHEQKSTVSSETLLTAETKVVCAVFWLGAQRVSLQIVEWALNASVVLPINEALEMVINEGHLAIVRALYPRVGDFGCACCKNEDELVESAASRGHLEILEWLVNYRSKTSKPCFLLVAMRCAAGGGHLDVVKWIHAKEPGKWTHVALEQAALHNQQLVMDWIHQEHLPVAASFAMQSATWKGNWSALAWLHDKYPDDRGDYQTAKRRRLGSQLEVVNC